MAKDKYYIPQIDVKGGDLTEASDWVFREYPQQKTEVASHLATTHRDKPAVPAGSMDRIIDMPEQFRRFGQRWGKMEVVNGQKKWRVPYSVKEGYEIVKLKNNITGIELFTHDKRSERTASGTFAATIVGSIALGPLGGIAGAMWGGKKKKTNKVGFGVQLKDGRQFIAEADFDVFVKIKSYVPLISTDTADTKECPMCAETVKAKAKICRFCQHKF